MKKIVTTLLIVLCSITTFSSSKREALTLNEINFVKDGWHVQVFYDNYENISSIQVTMGGPMTPGFYCWTPLPGSVNAAMGCFTGVIYVEDTPSGQVILNVNCNN